MARGLPAPLTITTDGAPGLLRAVAEQWPQSLRLRCWVHKVRNIGAKIPTERWCEVKGALVAIRDAATPAAGAQAAQAFLERYGKEFPAAAKCLSEDLDALLALLELPWRLRQFVRTTNLVERSFVEERRRSKTLPRFFTEQSCVKLVFATLIRAAERWQRIVLTVRDADPRGRAVAAHRAHAARVRAVAGDVSGAWPDAGATDQPGRVGEGGEDTSLNFYRELGT